VIPREREVEIARLASVESWPVGTIAAQLGVHHDAVERVLEQASAPRVGRSRASAVDPYVGFVQETWRKFPRLPASRLYRMCQGRGYPGAEVSFRRSVRPFRPRPVAEAFLRLKTLKGEQAQVDWAHFGHVTIGQAKRPLVGFVMVLSWSRAIFLRFYLGQQIENFLRGHEAAFSVWGGASRVVLYDNLKSAVLERQGDAIRFNRTILDFAASYRYEPRPVAPYRGNEKGRVERAIRYIRTGFFMARAFRDVDDLNAQADTWCQTEALARPWPEDPRITVREALEQERGALLTLPEDPYPTFERREVVVGKTPYVRFDGNDYSVPHTHVRRTLVVLASHDTVRVLDGATELARHGRSFDRRAVVEDPAHVKDLVEIKRAARKHRAIDQLSHACPSSPDLLQGLAERGKSLGLATHLLTQLLEIHGAASLEAAIREALDRGVPHVPAVRQILERERAARGLLPVVPVALPDDPKVHATVRPHALEGYDTLADHPTGGAA
jgi:transposase